MKLYKSRLITVVPAVVALSLSLAAAARADGGDEKHGVPEPSWVMMVAAASIPAGMAAMRKTVGERLRRGN